jgi:DNA-binding NarL/FixJ family response regulator
MISQPGENNKSIYISIIEDNPYVRAGWKTALAGEADLLTIGDFESCEAAFNSNRFIDSHVVLLDIELPGISGIEGAKKISEKYPAMHIIMTTMHDDDQHVFDAICAGAVGYLVKTIQPDELIHAVRDVVAGGSPMTPCIARRVLKSFQATPSELAADHEQLTDQEQTVLRHLAEGESYKAIAKAMFLSVDGIRYHIRHIYEKLHVRSRGEAVAKALTENLVRPGR